MADYDDISLIEKGEMSSFNILQRVSHMLIKLDIPQPIIEEGQKESN